MKKRYLATAAGVAAACLAIGFAGSANAATLKISCGSVGQELNLCKENVNAWAKKTGNQVVVISSPNDASERLAQYQQILSSGGDTIDVFQIDVVWPGTLGDHFIDLKPFSNGVEKDHFPNVVANNTYKGKLVGMPWYIDAGLLYYRKDLLSKYQLNVPNSWDELTAAAKKIQDAERTAGNGKMWGYVWQGRAYEGFTCNALEWVASYNGGAIIDAKGAVTINNPAAAKALQNAAGWIGTITPAGVLNYQEEDARGIFQSGNAVFMRNWPYAWSLLQKDDSTVKNKVGVAPLPKGGDGRSAAALGGWQLAVSKYSKNQKLAADLVMYLTSPAVEKQRAIDASFNPTIMSLYKDPDLLKANPFMGDLYSTFQNTVARPSTVTGERYNQVSNAFWNMAHEILSGKQKASDGVAKLQSDLNRLSRGGHW
ncbi:ABC transporter substrate-binding protein [Collimonas silvisoli]|uniref:ABC transporter substrate-binding protein n=1 Tax=Collimonas silvisoli TaxID=2825884 RepID=UPI001E563D7F|nr:ABC transporter substrate-binding protein [Collimonas silvisoli]